MNTNKITSSTFVSSLIENTGLFDQITAAIGQGQSLGDISKLVFQNLSVDLQNISSLREIETLLTKAFVGANINQSYQKSGSLVENDTTKFGAYDMSANINSSSGIQLDGEASMVEINDPFTGTNVKLHTIDCETELSKSTANAKCDVSAIKLALPQDDKNSWGLELRGPTVTVGLTAPVPLAPLVIKPGEKKTTKQSKPNKQPAKPKFKLAVGRSMKVSAGEVRLKTPSIQIGECDFDVTFTGSILTAGTQAKLTDRSAEIFLGLGHVGAGVKVVSDCSVLDRL